MACISWARHIAGIRDPAIKILSLHRWRFWAPCAALTLNHMFRIRGCRHWLLRWHVGPSHLSVLSYQSSVMALLVLWMGGDVFITNVIGLGPSPLQFQIAIYVRNEISDVSTISKRINTVQWTHAWWISISKVKERWADDGIDKRPHIREKSGFIRGPQRHNIR